MHEYFVRERVARWDWDVERYRIDSRTDDQFLCFFSKTHIWVTRGARRTRSPFRFWKIKKNITTPRSSGPRWFDKRFENVFVSPHPLPIWKTLYGCYMPMKAHKTALWILEPYRGRIRFKRGHKSKLNLCSEPLGPRFFGEFYVAIFHYFSPPLTPPVKIEIDTFFNITVMAKKKTHRYE